MTSYTNRNNIQMIFRLVAFVMMILLCLCRTVATLQRIWTGKFTVCNSMVHSFASFILLRMAKVKSFYGIVTGFSTLFALSITPLLSFAFFGLMITLLLSFAFFGLSVSAFDSLALFCFAVFLFIFRAASFAIIPVSIVAIGVLIKFRKGFGFFASSAGFGYDCVRHDLFPLQKGLCLGPVASHMLTAGSFIIYLPEKNKREFGDKMAEIATEGVIGGKAGRKSICGHPGGLKLANIGLNCGINENG